MITQKHGDYLHTIAKINGIRNAIIQLEHFDEHGVTALYMPNFRQYDAVLADIAEKFNTLTQESLETLKKELSTLEKSLIIDRNALMNSPAYHRTLEEHRTRFHYWIRQATKAGNTAYGMSNKERCKQLWRIARKAESLYRKAQNKAAL